MKVYIAEVNGEIRVFSRIEHAQGLTVTEKIVDEAVFKKGDTVGHAYDDPTQEQGVVRSVNKDNIVVKWERGGVTREISWDIILHNEWKQ